MSDIPFVTGLHQLTPHVHAWLRPDGSWGLSNAGLVSCKGKGLLVDTQYDLAMTGELKAAVQQVLGGKDPGQVVVTHGNGDHFFGASLFPEAEIVASEEADREMSVLGPGKMALFQKIHPFLGGAGRYFMREMGRRFQFSGIPPVRAGRTFREELSLDIEGLEVQVKEFGPLHSHSDSVVWIPEDKVLFAGDLLFTSGTPIIWEGDMEEFDRAFDWMEARGARYVVPGHGPVIGPEGLAASRRYMEMVWAHAQSASMAGLSVEQAARRIDLGEFAGLAHPERILINLAAFYSHLVPGFRIPSSIKVFGMMEKLVRYWKSQGAQVRL